MSNLVRGNSITKSDHLLLPLSLTDWLHLFGSTSCIVYAYMDQTRMWVVATVKERERVREWSLRARWSPDNGTWNDWLPQIWWRNWSNREQGVPKSVWNSGESSPPSLFHMNKAGCAKISLELWGKLATKSFSQWTRPDWRVRFTDWVMVTAARLTAPGKRDLRRGINRT